MAASAGRAAIGMTEQQTAAFLADHMKVQVGTVGPSGAPHLTTLYYVISDGRIAFWTYGSSQKVVNLRRDPRITCLVEDGEDYGDLRGVSVSGRARLVEDHDAVRALGARVASRMAGGADLGEAGEQLVDRQAAKRVGVVVEPDRVATWDHRKLQATTGHAGPG
ncbi:MAG: pyridoxamine 5'-phosphate oxidase family protein [Marmoricola sp.]